MRTRKEINDSTTPVSEDMRPANWSMQYLILEVLLDIRDLIISNNAENSPLPEK